MKKILLSILIACTISSYSAYADNSVGTVYDADSTTLTVSGVAEKNKNSALQIATLRVFKPGYTPEIIKNLSDDAKKSAIAFIKQSNVNADGSFLFTYTPKTFEFGVYQICVTLPNGETLSKNELFLDSTAKANILTAFNAADTAEKMSTALTDYSYIYTNSETVNDIKAAISSTDVMNSVADMIKGIQFSDAEKILKEIEKSAIVVFINEASSAEDIKVILDKYKEELDFSENLIYQNLYMSISDKICEQFLGKSYTTASEFFSDFCDKNILYKINTANNYVAVMPILYSAQNYLTGFNFEGYSNLADYKKVSAEKEIVDNTGSISKISDLETIFNNAIVNASKVSEQSVGNVSLGGAPSVGSALIGGNSISTIPTKEVFNDLASVEWARNSILNLYHKGIINGFDDGQFKPQWNVTREQFTKMIVTAFDIFDEVADFEYSDMESDAWYAPYIASAVKNGIVYGISEQLFGVGNNITRQDMAVIAYRALQKKGILINNDEETIIFKDNDDIAKYAEEAIYSLRKSGLINGKDSNMFAPKEFATRAEAAKMIDALISLK